MIPRCGSPTHIPHARPRAELAGTDRRSNTTSCFAVFLASRWSVGRGTRHCTCPEPPYDYLDCDCGTVVDLPEMDEQEREATYAEFSREHADCPRVEETAEERAAIMVELAAAHRAAVAARETR
jgi:hypothetical protein